MAKRSGRISGFAVGMIIYAAVFLILVGVGLFFFWQFIEAYELSRPKTAVEAYVSGLTEDQLWQGTEEFLAQIDENVQTREEAFRLIQENLTQEITYAKLGRESTSQRQEYVLRHDTQNIGRLAICPGEEGAFGFTPWKVTDFSFDFTYLMGSPLSVTVPEEYTVMVNGRALDGNYIVERDIPYPALKDFYGDFEMVTMVTYYAENFLGEPVIEFFDAEGNPASITAETDPDSLIPFCSEEEVALLQPLLETFLQRYVAFTGSANRNEGANYQRLIKCLVPDGALAKRLYTALDGLHYAQSNGDTIQEITPNFFYKVSQERYICDVSYVVETIGRKGAVQTLNNMKIVFVQTEDGPKVEAMTRY